MLERVLEKNKALVQIRSGRSPKIGSNIIINSITVKCIGRQDNFFILQFDKSPLEIFNAIGHIP